MHQIQYLKWVKKWSQKWIELGYNGSPESVISRKYPNLMTFGQDLRYYNVYERNQRSGPRSDMVQNGVSSCGYER